MYFNMFSFKNCEFYSKYIIYDLKILYNFFIMKFTCIRKVQSSKDISKIEFCSRNCLAFQYTNACGSNWEEGRIFVT